MQNSLTRCDELVGDGMHSFQRLGFHCLAFQIAAASAWHVSVVVHASLVHATESSHYGVEMFIQPPHLRLRSCVVQ